MNYLNKNQNICIEINNIEIPVILGILDNERKNKQKILVSIIYNIKNFNKKINHCDNIKNTQNYDDIINIIKKYVKNSNFFLIETLGTKLYAHINNLFSNISIISLSINKKEAYNDIESIKFSIKN